MNYTDFFWWAGLNILSLVILAFYSMQEMACVSLNKIRLHYYVSKGMKRANWLTYMLQDPARLFGTTLICVNAAMMAGSEFARKSYEALGINPDLAPLTQVIIVVIFAELAPMFAARRYAEHVALIGAPILYITAKVMTPFLWVLGWISKVANALIGGKQVESHVLSREDLQKILEEQDDERPSDENGKDFNTVTWNIFNLRTKEAKDLMQPIYTFPAMASNVTVGELKPLLEIDNVDFVPIYHRDIGHIVGIAVPRDLVRIPDSRRVRDYTRPPWFVTQNTKITQIIKEFRRNNNSIAIILNDRGIAVGILHLDDLIEEIFGEYRTTPSSTGEDSIIIERTFPGDTTVAEFNAQFDVTLDEDADYTLEELLVRDIGHIPEVGDSIYIAPFELTVKEASLMEIKKVLVTNRKH